MTPEEESIKSVLEDALSHRMTPTIISMFNDASIHAAFIAGMTAEQIMMLFTHQLSDHVPGVIRVEVRIYGDPAMYGSTASEPHGTPPSKQSDNDDAVARRLLGGLDFEGML